MILQSHNKFGLKVGSGDVIRQLQQHACMTACCNAGLRHEGHITSAIIDVHRDDCAQRHAVHIACTASMGLQIQLKCSETNTPSLHSSVQLSASVLHQMA